MVWCVMARQSWMVRHAKAGYGSAGEARTGQASLVIAGSGKVSSGVVRQA